MGLKFPRRFLGLVAASLSVLPFLVGQAAEQSAPEILFRDVRVFDGRSTTLSSPTAVLVRGNRIAAIGAGAVPANPAATIIGGGGRTLMPGLIDAHVHIMFATIPQLAVLTSDIGFVNVAAAKAANDMLLRGFTSIRDLGGPVFGLKQGIDAGLVAGPRIWPSGAFISQSGGHGDFRLPNDMPARPGDFTYSERVGAAAIADDPDTVRKRAREQLALGASQIKLMAGGGVTSNYDPLDVTQYTVPELRAAVEAAEKWGAYVTVHAYTPRAVRQSIEAGVRCIDHGQADGRERHLVEPAAVRGRQAVALPGGIGEPPQAARDVQWDRHRLRAREEAQGQDSVGHRHVVRRESRGGARRAARQDGPLVHAGRSAEDGDCG